MRKFKKLVNFLNTLIWFEHGDFSYSYVHTCSPIEIHSGHVLSSIIAENGNNQKLMAEYEKYQELQARSQKLQEVILLLLSMHTGAPLFMKYIQVPLYVHD